MNDHIENFNSEPGGCHFGHLLSSRGVRDWEPVGKNNTTLTQNLPVRFSLPIHSYAQGSMILPPRQPRLLARLSRWLLSNGLLGDRSLVIFLLSKIKILSSLRALRARFLQPVLLLFILSKTKITFSDFPVNILVASLCFPWVNNFLIRCKRAHVYLAFSVFVWLQTFQ